MIPHIVDRIVCIEAVGIIKIVMITGGVDIFVGVRLRHFGFLTVSTIVENWFSVIMPGRASWYGFLERRMSGGDGYFSGLAGEGLFQIMRPLMAHYLWKQHNCGQPCAEIPSGPWWKRKINILCCVVTAGSADHLCLLQLEELVGVSELWFENTRHLVDPKRSPSFSAIGLSYFGMSFTILHRPHHHHLLLLVTKYQIDLSVLEYSLWQQSVYPKNQKIPWTDSCIPLCLLGRKGKQDPACPTTVPV